MMIQRQSHTCWHSSNVLLSNCIAATALWLFGIFFFVVHCLDQSIVLVLFRGLLFAYFLKASTECKERRVDKKKKLLKKKMLCSFLTFVLTPVAVHSNIGTLLLVSPRSVFFSLAVFTCFVLCNICLYQYYQADYGFAKYYYYYYYHYEFGP